MSWFSRACGSFSALTPSSFFSFFFYAPCQPDAVFTETSAESLQQISSRLCNYAELD